MSRCAVVAFLAVAVMCAAAQCMADGFVMKQISVPLGYDPGTLGYNSQIFSATSGGEIETLSDDGVWMKRGIQGSNPAWCWDGAKILFVNVDGRPSVYKDGQVTVVSQDILSSPATPASNLDGGTLFADKSQGFLLSANSAGEAEKLSPFDFLDTQWGGPSGLKIQSVCYVDGDTVLTVGFQASHFGYKVVDGNRVVLTDSSRDPGEGPSKIVAGGGKVWGLWYDQGSIRSWDWVNGYLSNEQIVASGATYDLLGSDSEGAVISDGTNYWHLSTNAPEPGSFLGLAGGLSCLAGFALRRRRT